MKTTTLFATILLTSSLMTGCETMPMVNTNSTSMEEMKKRTNHTTVVSASEAEQMRIRQDLEVREAAAKAKKAQLEREQRNNMIQGWKKTKDDVLGFFKRK